MSAKTNQAREMRTTDNEISLFKASFAGKDDTLKLIRALLFGFELSAQEKTFVKELFASDDLHRAFTKFFLPELERDIPLGQQVDLWMTIQIAEKTKDQQVQIIKARAILIDAIKIGLALLRNPDGEKVHLTVDRLDERLLGDMTPWLVARNTFISHVEQMLMHIKILAGNVEETVEQTKERLEKNSGK